jgi:hypothetical protein
MNGIDAGLHKLGPEYDRLETVNEYFGDMEGLVSVHDDRLPHHWYGGGKALEAELAIGAENHLDLNAFIQHLRSMEWAYNDLVQLVVKEDDDDRFRIIDVFPEAGLGIDRFWERDRERSPSPDRRRATCLTQPHPGRAGVTESRADPSIWPGVSQLRLIEPAARIRSSGAILAQ